MKKRRGNTFCTAAALCFAALSLCACSGGNSSSSSTTSTPVVTNQNTASTNQTTVPQANTQSPRTPPSANAPNAASPTGGGNAVPVDTSKYDAQIKRLEQQLKKNPSDQTTRLALARAYTERGDALTGVAQYRSALGDYRRALRLNPNDEQAQQMSGMIIMIMQKMGRDVPPEGQEPPPLKQ
jgi:cytochrome c-type biogenesis protein CcmH/NrfG